MLQLVAPHFCPDFHTNTDCTDAPRGTPLSKTWDMQYTLSRRQLHNIGRCNDQSSCRGECLTTTALAIPIKLSPGDINTILDQTLIILIRTEAAEANGYTNKLPYSVNNHAIYKYALGMCDMVDYIYAAVTTRWLV